MGYTEERVRTFTAGAAIARGTRVKLSTGKVVAADAGDAWVGWTKNRTLADGDPVAVILRSNGGTVEARAGGAITAGATVKQDNGGDYVATTSGDDIWGIALTAAGGAADLFELLPFYEYNPA
jgi:hypothetical protein